MDRAMLLASYQRRKRWEADLQAVTLMKWLGEALSPKKGKGAKRTDAEAMLAMAGASTGSASGGFPSTSSGNG